jgi:DNA-binding LacI/PurR family transcriptional regulator
MEAVPPTEEASQRVTTIAEVAREAQVGVATVSRVLNGSPAVRSQTRTRVLDAIARLGYAPNETARALSTGRTRAVGVVAPFFTRPSVIERLRGVSRVLAPSGYQLVLFDAESRATVRLWRELADGGRLDGLLAISLCPPAAELARFAATGVPVVLVDEPHDGVPAVHADDVAGGRLATEHLLGLGHRRVAFVGDHEPGSARRRAGYECAHADAGRDVDPALLCRARQGREAGAAIARELLESADPPTALFASSDMQAVGALEGAEAVGATVPDDLSVVGYDDIELARYAGLTTVAQPLEESGAHGAALLLGLLAGAPVAGRQLPVELIVRSTTGPAGTRRTQSAHKHRPRRRERAGRVSRDGERVRS